MSEKQRGFSLIELMIVVTIIGILAAIAIPSYMGIQKKAQRSELRTNLATLRLLEEKRFAERGTYIAGATTDALVLAIPDFKPGDTARLRYDYSVALTGPPPGFTATATGKAGTRDQGFVCSIDQDNVDNPSGCVRP
ncbi:MAG: prepilin-type N-terminal cleavage/methylation domain-containing protein [bacterium]